MFTLRIYLKNGIYHPANLPLLRFLLLLHLYPVVSRIHCLIYLTLIWSHVINVWLDVCYILRLPPVTCPDISYYAMWHGQLNAAPTRAHFLMAKHVLRYLAGTVTFALCLGASSPRVPSTLSGYMQNVGCSDADWASDTIDRKSIFGYSFYFQGSLISWSVVKQKSNALSSTEAKYYAMTHAFKEAIWLRTFLSVLKFPVPRPFPILSDNQAACSLSNSPAISARSKHIDQGGAGPGIPYRCPVS